MSHTPDKRVTVYHDGDEEFSIHDSRGGGSRRFQGIEDAADHIIGRIL